MSHVIERLRVSGAQIEYARLFGMIEKPEIDRDNVVYENEITHLLAGTVSAVFSKQLDATLGPELVKLVVRDTGHAALVLLVRTVDVEIAEPRDLWF